MELLSRLILYALAAFRLAELLVIDDGPFDLFYRLRGWANKPPTGTWFRGTLAGILSCVHCAGLWLAILLGLAYVHRNTFFDVVIFLIAVAGLQSIISGKLGRTS